MLNLDKEIKDYCEANGLDVEEYKLKILRIGFNIDRYGNKPTFFNDEPKVVEKIVEKIIEVPKEKIVEVPVDNKEIEGLLETYRQIIESKDKEIEKLKSNNNTQPDDFYGDNKRGSYGSNIM